MPDDLWVVPGTPLQDGSGWRLWYSQAGTDPPAPKEPVVTRPGERLTVKMGTPRPLERLPDLDRRATVVDVRVEPPAPGAAHDVTIPELGRTFSWRTLPASVEDGLTFVMGSCFWINDDREGFYAAALAELQRVRAPHFKLLMGDQLYQDWPPRLDGGTRPYLLYARRYLEYWGDPGYQDLLRSAPNVFACDDHEFWNNYPEVQPQAPWTLFAREESRDAARAMFEHFQHSANPDGRRYFTLDVPPVSVFVSDSRSERTRFEDDPRYVFSPDQWAAMEDWAHGLTGPGLLVLSQPLFQELGDFKDYSLGNFERDYERLLGLFVDAAEGRTGDGAAHDVAVLTGDIHTGRHSVATLTGHTDASLHEFVASPASLVGPFQPLQKPSLPPAAVAAKPVGWDIDVTEDAAAPTVANNVGVVRIEPGRNDRVRLRFEIWRVREYDSRRYWQRLLKRKRPEGGLRLLMTKEVELR